MNCIEFFSIGYRLLEFLSAKNCRDDFTFLLVMSEARTWWKEAVVYQIYPRSFKDSNGDGIGDLKGIISKLDYLKELGITCVWLSPVYKTPNDDGGYDISDYEDICEDFGTMDDWKVMIEEMHKRGIKLVMDLVANHTSDEHPWFVESRQSKDSPKRDWYWWRPPKADGSLPNNWTACFGGPAWEYDEKTGEYFLHLFSKRQPDVNWENPKVRKAIYDMMDGWFKRGIDGFRMDVISQISKNPALPDGKVTPGGTGGEHYNHGPRQHEFLQEMNREVLSKYDCMTVGECHGVTPDMALQYVGSDRHELSMVFQFELNNIDADGDKWHKKDYTLQQYKAIQTRWQKSMYQKGWNSLFMMNHDEPRVVSRWGNDSPEFRVVSAKMLATMNHTLQGTPYVYQGEEIGMTNIHWDKIEDYRDIETLNYWKDNALTGLRTKEETMAAIQYIGRDNSRTPMQWDDSEYAGFSTHEPWIMLNENYKEINAKKDMANPNSIFNYYKKLIQLRKENVDVFVYARYEVYYEDSNELYVYTRSSDNKLMLVALNWTKDPQPFKVPEGVDIAGAKLLISNYENTDAIPTTLRPYEAIVYLKQ